MDQSSWRVVTSACSSQPFLSLPSSVSKTLSCSVTLPFVFFSFYKHCLTRFLVTWKVSGFTPSKSLCFLKHTCCFSEHPAGTAILCLIDRRIVTRLHLVNDLAIVCCRSGSPLEISTSFSKHLFLGIFKESCLLGARQRDDRRNPIKGSRITRFRNTDRSPDNLEKFVCSFFSHSNSHVTH